MSAPEIDERWRTAERVLAVRLDNLGDVLVTTPAIHAIKTSLPDARVTLFASPVGAQAGRLNPDLDGVIVHQAPWMDPWHTLPLDSAREQAAIARIKAGRFDAAVIFTSFRQSPLPAAYLCYLADVPLRLAASIDGPGSLLTTRHKHPERPMHEVERGLDLVAAVGLATDESDLVLRVPDEARVRAREWLAARRPPLTPPPTTGNGNDAPPPALPPIPGAGQGVTSPGLPSPAHGRWAGGEGRRPLVVLHPGCSMPARTYPWQQFADEIDLLVAELGASVVLTGAADERELVGRIHDRLSPEAKAATRLCAGELPFPEFCALIEAADLVVTNNTGPMHVAAALKTPVVALFALTNPPEQWGPWRVPHRLLNHDVPCRLCYSRVCPYEHDCLRLVTPAMVLAAAADLLAEAHDGQGVATRPPSPATAHGGNGHGVLRPIVLDRTPGRADRLTSTTRPGAAR